MADINFEEYERQFVEEVNKFRVNPQGLIPHLEALIPKFKDNVLYREGELPVQTNEGETAVKEAINELLNHKPLPELILDTNVSNAARVHCIDIGNKGLVSHDGSDGSTVSDRLERYCEWEGQCAENIDFGTKKGLNALLSFIIDDGVPNRGHRKNLLNGAYRLFGIAMGPHKEYEVVLVVNFVQSIREKDKPFHDLATYKYNYPPNIDSKDQSKPKKIKNQYQLDDEDAPDNTVSVRTVKQTKLFNGKVHRVTKKFYTLSDGSTTIVEVEDL